MRNVSGSEYLSIHFIISNSCAINSYQATSKHCSSVMTTSINAGHQTSRVICRHQLLPTPQKRHSEQLFMFYIFKYYFTVKTLYMPLSAAPNDYFFNALPCRLQKSRFFFFFGGGGQNCNVYVCCLVWSDIKFSLCREIMRSKYVLLISQLSDIL